jgi:hypothetical protein
MRNSSLQFYGLLVIFIGVIATAAACLGTAFGLGLLSANGSLSLRNLLFLRDALFFLLLGLSALRFGSGIRQYSRRALVSWEWAAWTIATLVMATTLAAIVLVSVGVEYLVFTVFYLLMGSTATAIRRSNQGFFDSLARQQGSAADGQINPPPQ